LHIGAILGFFTKYGIPGFVIGKDNLIRVAHYARLRLPEFSEEEKEVSRKWIADQYKDQRRERKDPHKSLVRSLIAFVMSNETTLGELQEVVDKIREVEARRVKLDANRNNA